MYLEEVKEVSSCEIVVLILILLMTVGMIWGACKKLRDEP